MNNIEESFQVKKIIGLGFLEKKTNIVIPKYHETKSPECYLEIVWKDSVVNTDEEYRHLITVYEDEVIATWWFGNKYYIRWGEQLIPLNSINAGSNDDNDIYKKLGKFLKNPAFKRDRKNHPQLKKIFEKYGN